MQMDWQTEKNPDQTAHSDLDLFCLIRYVNIKTLGHYGKWQWPGAQGNFLLFKFQIPFLTVSKCSI